MGAKGNAYSKVHDKVTVEWLEDEHRLVCSCGWASSFHRLSEFVGAEWDRHRGSVDN